MKAIRRNFPLIFLVLAGLFFWGNFISSRIEHHKRKVIPLSHIHVKAREKRSFAILMPRGASKKTLESVEAQVYPSFRWVDFASSTELYEAIQKCAEEEILIFLGKEDWLAHEDVLERVNLCYEDPTVWVTYGNYISYPSYKKGSSKAESHLAPLQTGYAGLFKKIRKADLILGKGNGFFIPATQMAGEHLRYIPDVLYVQKQREDLEKNEWERLQSLQTYAPLTKWKECR